MIRFATFAWACFVGASLMANEPPGRTYDLSRVQGAERFEGSEEARRLLERQGFVVTEKQFRQIFEAYLSLHGGTSVPKFITVDSAWHTYHVLLEAGVQRFEEGQAVTLTRFSRELYRLARMKIGAAGDVYDDLALFAGVGWTLQNENALSKLHVKDRRKVQDVLTVLRQGGPPRRVLFFRLPVMPEQYRAAGSYLHNPRLAGYFAARKWYATNVFRVASPAETKRAFHVALLIESDTDLKRWYEQLTAPYDALLGPAEDAGVDRYVSLAQRTMGQTPSPEHIHAKLEGFRERAAKLPAPKILDQYVLPKNYEQFGHVTKGFRLFPPRRVPSAVLFQRTVDPQVKDRMFPSGLDFFATGPMASEAGRRALRHLTDDATAEAILAVQTVKLPDSLHGQALSLLRRLREPLPEQVPGPLRTAAWQDKQLFTQLGAWAQQRHTWASHTKMTIHYGGFTDEPPGYVSPYPEFFRGLARLSRNASGVLREVNNPEARGLVAGHALLDLVAAARRVDTATEKQTGSSTSDCSKSQRLREFGEAAAGIGEQVIPVNSENLDAWRPLDYASLERIAGRWIESTTLSQRDRELIALLSEGETKAPEYLVEFADLCDRLAAIAEKQLAGTPLSEEDVKLIKGYGKTLARFHFYGGNSYLTPRDDFPQVVPIFSSPVGNHNELLYAGLPRPEAIYVIIHVDDRPVLHRGAVLSYREFRRPIDEPLDDESWAREVRESRIPPPPTFTSSFRQTITEQEVARMLRRGKRYSNAAYIAGDMITDAMLDALMKGESEDLQWLHEQIARRVTETHLPRLLTYLEKHDHDGELPREIVSCVAALDWRPYRKRLLALLHRDAIEVPNAAARILGRRPDDLDTTVLARHYEQGRRRTKRLIGYLLGQLKHPDERAFELVLEMMDSKYPDLRYQAVLAGSRWQANGVQSDELPETLRRGLIDGIEDKNDVVAGTAVQAVVALGLTEAAPTMLKRLKDETAVLDPQDAAPVGLDDVPGRWLSGGLSLVSELLAGIETFGYQPATEHLRAMVKSKPDVVRGKCVGDWGPEALDTLVILKPTQKTELWKSVMHDADVWAGTRSRAVERLGATHELAHVSDLLPLLKEDAELGHYSFSPNSFSSDYQGFFVRPKFLGGSAALAVAMLLWSADPDNPKHNEIQEEAVEALIPELRTANGRSALAALASIERDDALNRVMRVAMDRKLPAPTRLTALDLLERTSFERVPIIPGDLHQDVRHLKRLLPLIQDDTEADFRTIGHRAAWVVARLARALAENPEHAKDIAQVRAHLASLLETRHASTAFAALEGIDPKQASAGLMAVANNRELAAESRARALNLIKHLPREAALTQSMTPLLADQTVAEQHKRICDLVARMIAVQLKLDRPFTRSSRLEDRNAFVERVRRAIQEGDD
ncbi:MAG: DUF3160 domain-containing protein [Pirellulaceae bacterium]